VALKLTRMSSGESGHAARDDRGGNKRKEKTMHRGGVGTWYPSDPSFTGDHVTKSRCKP
jgi:hypothetical protein